jgi:ABC-type uncharacterized transport system involved in gliding motility auxiliary subunit
MSTPNPPPAEKPVAPNAALRRRLSSGIALALLAIVFIALVSGSGLLLRGARIDLTQNRLYTLSPGTLHILDRNRTPITLQLYLSKQAVQELPQVRTYAQRVRELMQEITAKSHGRIVLQVLDPQPFTDAEDRAAAAGLQAVPLGTTGNTLYFGLVGSNTHGGQATAPFFDPNKEVFLEYDIAKLISALSDAHKPVVGLLSSLPSGPSLDPATGRVNEGWAIDSELTRLFELRRLQADPTSIGADVDLLMVLHPKSLSDDTLYAIDQFVLRGGRLLVFVDPFAEADPAGEQHGVLPGGTLSAASSSLDKLFSRWGIVYSSHSVVRDMQNALQVQPDPQRQPATNPLMLGLGKDQLNQQDVVSAQLDLINFSTAGALDLARGSALRMQPLAQSSTQSDLLDTVRARLLLGDPVSLLNDFAATGKSYVLAARYTGPLASAFPERTDARHLAVSHGAANMIVVADTDLLTDRLWVNAQNFFGRRLANAFANNGDFVFNMVDNLVGNPDLIALRARPGAARPFTVVEKLQRRANARLRGKEAELQTQLGLLEQKLAELQPQKSANGTVLTATPEQAAELKQFQLDRQRIRRELRDVRHQLDADIQKLGTRLKVIDILAVPLLLTLLVIVIAWRRRAPRDAG